MPTKKFLKCLKCDYLNEMNVSRCEICGSSEFSLYIKRDNKSFYYYLLFFIFVIIIFLFYFRINDKDNINNENQEDLTFVSEKIPSNYYTYISSLKKMSKFEKPDKNDINAMINALRYEDKEIREISCKTLKKWRKLPQRYSSLCQE